MKYKNEVAELMKRSYEKFEKWRTSPTRANYGELCVALVETNAVLALLDEQDYKDQQIDQQILRNGG